MRKTIVVISVFLLVLGLVYYSLQDESSEISDKVAIENINSPEIEPFSIVIYYLNTGNTVLTRNNDSVLTDNEEIGFRSNFPKEMKFITENNGVRRFPKDFRQDLYVVDVEDEKGYLFSHPVKPRAISASEVIELLPYIPSNKRCTSDDFALLSYVRDSGYFPNYADASDQEIIEQFCKPNPEYNNLVIRDGLTNIPDGDYYLRFMIYDSNDETGKLVAAGKSEVFSIQTDD